jgi:hypothetical protein
LPKRVVLWERQILAVDVPADRDAAQSQPFDAVFELLGRKIRMLKRDRGESDKAIRVGRHPLRKPFVLGADDLARQVAISRVPPVAVNAQRLDIDGLLIHKFQTLRTEDVIPAAAAVIGQWRAFDDLQRRYHAVRVHVDNSDAAATHNDLPTFGASLERFNRRIASPQAHHAQARRRAPSCP